MYDLIIKNGNVVDGTGALAVRQDIAVHEEKIAAIGDLSKEKARRTIDASGMYVAPGFIDIQNHSDAYWSLFERPDLQAMARQGITTILVGNCGASLAPLFSSQALLSIQKWHKTTGLNANWVGFGEYLDELSKKGYGTNIASLVGYSTLRRGILGDEVRQFHPDEMKKVFQALKQSIKEGAFGLSCGLSYSHEAIVGERELVELAKIISQEEALFSVHLRSEGSEIMESLAEVLSLATLSKPLNLKISHLKIKGSVNWNLLPHVLEDLENVYQKLGNLHYDAYPYDFTWQVLYGYLPRWSYEGGRGMLLKNIKDPIKRKKILAYLNSRDIKYSELFIASTAAQLNASGKSLGEIARRLETTSEEALLSIIENGGSDIMVFEKDLEKNGVKRILSHPLAMISTDGAALDKATDFSDELVHPRCFGAMPEFLHMSLSENLMGIEEAVHKITGIPAMKMGLSERGILKTGNYADIAIFSSRIKSNASMQDPYRFPEGIEYVMVNGELTVESGDSVSNRPGKVLRKKIKEK